MRLFKRRKTYYIEFKRGVKRSLGTSDKKEAQRLFKIAKTEYLRGKLIKLQTDRMTVKEFIDQYLETRFDVSDPTRRKDKISLNLLPEHIGSDACIQTLKEADIAKIKSSCLAQGLKKTSINAYLRHIRTALNWAHDQKIIKKPIKVKMFKPSNRLPRTLITSEIDKIRTFAKKTDFEIYRMIEFALWTGCRREEIKNLTWQNVKGDHLRIVGKGEKERIVPLLPGAMEAMGEIKDLGPVFLQIHLDTISHRFKVIARACNMEDVKFHTLRHSAATRMVESGIRIEIIQKILGHSDISTTKIYAKIFDQVVKDEMSKLSY